MPKRSRYHEELETGDHVWDDMTKAIRSKYQRNHIRGHLLTKCPICHEDFSEEAFGEHRLQCPKPKNATQHLTPAPQSKSKPTSPASRAKRQLAVRVNSRTALCKHCQSAVLNTPETPNQALQPTAQTWMPA